MAKIYPDLETIHSFKPLPTEGEFHLLNYLQKNLNDEYEIYFHPCLNGDRPDILVLRKNAGILIIQIKDWDLNDYTIDEYGVWKLHGILIKSPLKQVQEYKNNIFNLHVPGLLEKKIENSKIYGFIKPIVYFHHHSQKDLENFLQKEKEKSYIQGYLKVIGKDGIGIVNDLLPDNYLFEEKIYNDIKNILHPKFHPKEQGKNINYNKKQSELIISKSGEQKIKGVAGSGKTMVLARRAVNAYKRTGGKVLILTFNITLKNYLYYNINDIQEDFSRNAFDIFSYHQFIRTEANNLGVEFKKYSPDDENLFECVKNNIKKYDAIFIDEIQDYKTSRLRIIKKYFLKEGGEFVVFGDEKQNIYKRKLDDQNLPNTTIPGGWNILTESYRLSDNIATLAFNFQKEFFKERYNLENINIIQENLFSNPKIEHIIFPKNMPITMALDKVYEFIHKENIQINDVCLLSSRVEVLREFDYLIRTEKKEKTITTFESKERFESKKNDFKVLEKIRRNKKHHFCMDSVGMKLSTIYSFKGREIPTLILVINNLDNENDDELIYTAITRARKNLIIINIENDRYTQFFNTYINNAEEQKENIIKEIESSLKDSKGKHVQTLEETVKNEMKFVLENRKEIKNKPYMIAVFGDTTEKPEEIKEKLKQYFEQYDIRFYTDRNIEFFGNNDFKKRDFLKSFRRGKTKFSLIITCNIYKHSSPGNESSNMITELKKGKYIPLIQGSKPTKKTTTREIIQALDNYLKGET